MLVLERLAYPAHKLCGEFLSVEVAAMFARLGVLGAVEAAGAVALRRSRVTAETGESFDMPLPGTALGLSRYRLDALLMEAVRTAGGDARDASPVRGVEGSWEDGFTVAFGGRGAEHTVRARAVVGAFGKRSGLDGKLNRDFLRHRTPYVGLKAHFEGDDLEDVIELHAFRGGYCGLSHVEDGLVNGCWIAREADLKAAGSPERMLETTLRRNPHLADRLDRLRRVTPFQAVSQVTFRLKGKFDGGLAMVGDTAGMIAPLCGDGMAMALRGAELLAPRLAALLDGRTTRPAFEADYAHAWDGQFGLRLGLGRTLHALYTRPAVASAALRLCTHAPSVGRWIARHTRG